MVSSGAMSADRLGRPVYDLDYLISAPLVPFYNTLHARARALLAQALGLPVATG